VCPSTQSNPTSTGIIISQMCYIANQLPAVSNPLSRFHGPIRCSSCLNTKQKCSNCTSCCRCGEKFKTRTLFRNHIIASSKKEAQTEWDYIVSQYEVDVLETVDEMRTESREWDIEEEITSGTIEDNLNYSDLNQWKFCGTLTATDSQVINNPGPKKNIQYN